MGLITEFTDKDRDSSRHINRDKLTTYLKIGCVRPISWRLSTGRLSMGRFLRMFFYWSSDQLSLFFKYLVLPFNEVCSLNICNYIIPKPIVSNKRNIQAFTFSFSITCLSSTMHNLTSFQSKRTIDFWVLIIIIWTQSYNRYVVLKISYSQISYWCLTSF